MILEGVVTTVSAAGELNIAPMGPRVPDSYPDSMTGFQLRPFTSSRTYRNLREHPEGVLHVVDDVLLLAQAAVAVVDPPPRLEPAQAVRGWRLVDASRAYEFRITACDDAEPRVTMEAEVVASAQGRPLFGFNRARHAVVEATILATRTALLPLDQIEAEFDKLAVLVEKTGGPREHEAMAFLRRFLEMQKERG